MEQIDSKQAFDLVHDYLIHSGFVGTLRAFEDESSFSTLKQQEEAKEENEFAALKNKSTFAVPRKNTLGPDSISPVRDRSKMIKPLTADPSEGSRTARGVPQKDIIEETPGEKEIHDPVNKEDRKEHNNSEEQKKEEEKDSSSELVLTWHNPHTLPTSSEISLNSAFDF